jgi:hypothetical protein
MNDTFCVMPFYGAEYSKNKFDTPCCLMARSNRSIKTIQQEMLKNQRPVECSKCWVLEDQQIQSDRQIKNTSYDFYANKDIRFVKDDCANGVFSEQIVKLYTSNLCNSTCVTCNEHSSSKWASLKNTGEKMIKINDSQINNIDFKNLKMLSFVGGEPLYEKKNFDVLQRLIDSGNTSCFVSLVTNGSIHLNREQLAILSKFSRLNFCVSIDGIGPTFEYIRYPLTWDRLLLNLQQYRDLGIQLTVSYTISNLNILQHSATVGWFRDAGLSYNHNLVSSPTYFNLNCLPEHVKKSNPNKLFREHRDQDDLDFRRFSDEILTQDLLKNISIADYLPDLFTLLKPG